VRRQEDQAVYALKKVKMLNLSDKEKENALNEVRILASIMHQNVIAYKEAFIDEASSCLCLVMEYADNGDVFQKICTYQKRETYIKEKKIWYIFIQIVRGLKALHDRKILHRDMKSANIFLYRDMQAKLGDLNVSKIVKKGLSYTQTGTPYYASPEVWRDMPYDSKSDIWSLGCVLYEMCALVPPFRADDMQGLYKKVIKGKYPRIPEHFSQEMATVTKFMLQTSPSYRPNCDQILGLPIIESLIKKFFPEETQSLNLPDAQQSENEILLKTIRLSKNIFSLTERLPKAQYRSPRVFGSMAHDNSNGSLLPSLNVNSRNQVSNTIQPGQQSKAQSDQKPVILNSPGLLPQDGESKYLLQVMPKSRLDKNKDYHENQDDEEGDNSLENAGGGSQPNLKMAKGAKGQRGQKTTGKGGSSDLEGTGDQA
jgi:serine/threonine protein kinase